MHNLALFKPKKHYSDQKTLQISCKFLASKFPVYGRFVKAPCQKPCKYLANFIFLRKFMPMCGPLTD